MKQKKTKKPKYHMWQNVAYMISLAWHENEKMVLVLSLLTALNGVLGDLVTLFVTPAVLAAVENHVPLSQLILTILGFVGLMMLTNAADMYIETNTQYGRMQLRLTLTSKLAHKSATTSYENLTDENFYKLQSAAYEPVGWGDSSAEAIWNTLTNLTKNIIGFVIYLLLVFSLDPWMLLVVVATTVVSFFVNRKINGYGYRHREERADAIDRMWYIGDHAKGLNFAKDIRLFHLRPWLNDLQDKAMDAFVAFQRKANNVYIWGRITDLVLTFLRNGIAYAYLIHLALTQGLTASEFLLYFSAVGGFTSWVQGILSGFANLHKQSLEISTMREYLTYHEPFRFEDGEPLPENKTGGYELQLRDVSYRYPNSEEYTLKHINLTLHAGEKLAVVGLNGAGKTTLVKLLCGFLDPTEGEVLLNGEDIRKYNRREYYTLFSAVFQDFSLLAASIAANVAQSEDDIDLEKVQTCIAQAGLTAKVDSLSNGLDTHLERMVYDDAITLSGGETQRLMLARALYKDAPILLLDEPTAALDPIAESELYEKYSEMTDGKSSVYISHRLASTRFCDRIIFLSGGEISEIGTHSELIKAGGGYAELFDVQSHYYKEGTEDE